MPLFLSQSVFTADEAGAFCLSGKGAVEEAGTGLIGAETVGAGIGFSGGTTLALL
jgi:hypothetical protein